MLSDSDIASLETATLDAVAPQQLESLDGWLLPFDHSTIGRAKSAVPLRHSNVAAESLERIFARYAFHQLPAHFRLAECTGLQPIYSALNALRYAAQQATLVQIATVDDVVNLCPASNANVTMSRTATTDWAAVYGGQGFDPVDAAHRVQALSRSPFVVYASISDAQGPVASGTASFSQGWASIHGMRTLERGRGKGWASAIVATLAREAQHRGIHRIFLQVDAGNHAAQSVYRRFGFRTAWTYHYWRPDA